MKRPLLAVVSLYVIGLLIGKIFQPSLSILFAASFAVLILIFILERFRPLLVWLLLVFVGWTNFIFHTAIISPNDLRTLVGNETQIVTVRGTLTETPDTRIFLRDEEEVQRSLARVRVAALKDPNDGHWQPAAGLVVVTTPGLLSENYFVGQPVEIGGVLALPDAPRAKELFDYRDHLKKLGIYYALKTTSTNDWQPGENILTKSPLSCRFIAWASKTLSLGLDASDESTKLLLAMTLGQKTALTDEVSEPFMRSGTMHIFAISGLHIALIAGILLGLLRVVRVPRAICGLIVLPLIWFYTGATGWQPSAIRSTIMMSVIIGGWMLNRPGDLINSLAAAAFIILLLDPLQLFQASFQLSFFVVLSIALIAPPLNKIRDRLLQTDPLLPTSLVPRWRRVIDAPLRWLTTCLTTSLAAWIGSMPLTAYYFHLFSPVTLLANIVIVPLSGFALMAQLGSVICGTWFPWVTEIFNNAAWFFMYLMVMTSEKLTAIPGAFFYLPSPSWITIGIYFAMLIAVLSGRFNNAHRKIFGATISAFIMAIYFFRWQSSRDETELTVLSLNGGHAIYIDADGWKNDWLIDCGSESAVEFTLKPFLRGHGANKIPRLVLSEGDVKNCGGTQVLNESFDIQELWTSNAKFRSGIYNLSVATFKKSSRYKILNTDDKIGCWKVLYPNNTNNFTRSDDSALVILGIFYNTKVLLLSDLSRAGQNELLSRTNDLRAEIVIAGLPNESEPLSEALIDVIKPKLIVIADSEFPATRRANSKLRERLEQKGIPVIYTRTSGAATIVTDENGWNLRTMNGQRFTSGVSSK
jgi:ComEC/Rec2-related protein